MKVIKLVALILCLLRAPVGFSQEDPNLRDDPRIKKVEKSSLMKNRQERKKRNLPKLDRQRIAKLKKLMRKKKSLQVRDNKRDLKKKIAVNTHRKRRLIQRQRRLRLLKLAQDRLRQQQDQSISGD